MGCSSGKIGTSLPPQESYSGSPVEYHYVTIEATMDIKRKFGFLNTDVEFQSTNIDSYFHKLESMYAQGYRMLAFFPLQDAASYGALSRYPKQMKMKYHGIFRKSFPEESGQQWQLVIEKSAIVNQMFRQAKILGARVEGSTDSFHLMQTLGSVAQRGGRLVAIELSGMAEQELGVHRQIQNRRKMFSMNAELPAMQMSVDVFYEMPCSSSSGKYVYQIVNCPMTSSYKREYPRGRFYSTIEWQKLMADYLGKGWRLVDIFEDHTASAHSQMTGITAKIEMTKNCLWVFEKPESSMDSNTPRYEGTMVEHYFKAHVETHAMGLGGAGMNVTADFEPVLNHMGKYGWELVRILSTPDAIVPSSFTRTFHVRQLIFFQRKIVEKSYAPLHLY